MLSTSLLVQIYNTCITFQVVKKYFCIQATGCSSEGTLSTCDSIVTATRSKLDPTNVHMAVYLRENLGRVKLDKLIVEDPEEEKLEEECQAQAQPNAQV